MKKNPIKVRPKIKSPANNSLRIQRDAKAYELMEKRVVKFKKLYSFISEINQMIVRTTDETTLFHDTCQIAIRIGKFRMAWIGILDHDTKLLNPVMHSGYEKGYLAKIKKIRATLTAAGRGPTGEALRKGQYIVCNDIETDPRMVPWKEEALARGYYSSIALPLKRREKIIGAISIYAGEKNFFTKDEIKLLREAAYDISFALEILENNAIQKKSEEEITFLYEIYEKVQLATSDTIWDWDIKKDTLQFNKGIIESYGYAKEMMVSSVKWREKNIHPDDLERVQLSIADCFEKKTTTISLEYRFKAANNKFRFVYDRAFIVFYKGKPIRMVGAMQDITFQKEEELRLAKTIIKAQEAERHFIGQELHDNVNQLLVASQLNLGMVKKMNPEKAAELIDNIKGYISTAINEIRNLSHQLSPSSFGDVTLKDVFENLLQGINANNDYKIHLKFHYPQNEPLDQDLQITLYRILQEALNNIVKYASASNIEIIVDKTEKGISMSIADNGVGFNITSSKKGIGLNNIKRRVESFEGSFKITSTPGKGCKIQVLLPL